MVVRQVRGLQNVIDPLHPVIAELDTFYSTIGTIFIMHV